MFLPYLSSTRLVLGTTRSTAFSISVRDGKSCALPTCTRLSTFVHFHIWVAHASRCSYHHVPIHSPKAAPQDQVHDQEHRHHHLAPPLIEGCARHVSTRLPGLPRHRTHRSKHVRSGHHQRMKYGLQFVCGSPPCL